MKKFLAILLSAAMVLCMMPAMAFATGETPKDLKDVATVTLSDTTLEYTGKAQEPTVTVTLKEGGKLTKDTDYTIAVEPGRTAVGEKILTVTGIGGYTGTIETKYTIVPKDISKCTVTIPEQTIGETFNTDGLIIKNGEKTLVKDTDYTLPTELPIVKAGGTFFSITAKGHDYTGSLPITYYAYNELDSGYTLEIKDKEKLNFVYDGNTKTISQSNITVKKNGTDQLLTFNRDYTITYKNNINAGTATITATGIGDYRGSLEETFYIAPKEINKSNTSVTVSEKIAGTDENSVHEKVVVGGKTLKRGTDYTLGMEDITSGILWIKGMGNYLGAIDVKVSTGASITDAKIIMSTTSFDYTGYAITPSEIVVKLGDKTLKKGTDYKLVYEDNTKVGIATIKVIGINTYAGTVETYFSISAKNLNDSDVKITVPESVLYDGKKAEPPVTVTHGSRTLTKNIDYTLDYYSNDKIGNGIVYVTGKGNYTGSVSKIFKITGKSIATADVTLSDDSYIYDGLAKKPSITVYDGYKRLTNGIDYTVTYQDNRNVGTAKVIITGKGNYSGTQTVTFRIIGKEQTVTTKYTRYSKTLASKPFNLYADHDGDGYLVYRSSDPSVATVSVTGTVTVKGTGRAIITVSTAGTVKYDPAYKEVTVTVKPATPKMTLSSTKKNVIKVTFTKVDGATKYQVRYGRMGRYFYKYVTHKDNEYPKTYTTLKNRTSGKPYYIKVRAYKTLADGTRVYGDWTDVKSIRSK